MVVPVTDQEVNQASRPKAHASTFARVGVLVYALLIVYASLFPFSNWQSKGLPPFGYLTAPLPHYWTMFDLAANVLAYIPLGLLIVFALYPQLRRVGAVILAIVAGALLSGSVEALQNFLPSRIPSNLDLITNTTGALIGALAGALLTPVFLEQSRFLQLRGRWFSPEASRGLIVIGLWPLAQIYPQAYLFGHGQITPILSNWMSDWLEIPIDLNALMRRQAEITIEQYWLSETIITACGLTGAMLTLLCVLRKEAPKIVIVFLFGLSAFMVKALSSALLFAPEYAFTWLTPGAEGGIIVALLMLCGLAFAPPTAQRLVAALALITSLIAVNIAPSNPYFLATLQTWIQGKFLNFNGATQFLALLWPFIALWFLYHPVHRLKKSA